MLSEDLTVNHSLAARLVKNLSGSARRACLSLTDAELTPRAAIQMAGLPFIPVTLTPLPMPVHYHIHYGAPIRTDLEYRPEHADDPAAVREASARVKAAVQALLDKGLAERKGIFA